MSVKYVNRRGETGLVDGIFIPDTGFICDFDHPILEKYCQTHMGENSPLVKENGSENETLLELVETVSELTRRIEALEGK